MVTAATAERLIALSPAGVYHYLRNRRFLSAGAAVETLFEVCERTRRNRNFLVTDGDTGWVVKQVKTWTDEFRSSLAQEARWYWLAGNDERYAPLRGLMPRCVSWDPANSILILERLREAPADYERMGRSLAAMHREMNWIAGTEDLPQELPGFLQVHRSGCSEDDSGGRRELVDAICEHKPIGVALDELSAEWRARTLIHWDCKIDNWLADRLVDWELAAVGDPAWDAATLLQSIWSDWVIAPQTAVDFRPSLAAFWRGYAESGAPLPRVLRFAGARMLQTAFEQLQNEPHMTPGAVRMLQMAANMLADVRAAQREFFGD